MYNRPRQSYPPHLFQHPPPLTLSNKMAFSSGNSQYSSTVNTSDVLMYGDPALSPTNTSSSGGGGPASHLRKFICNPAEKSHSTYNNNKQVPVPPKLKSNPRDTRLGGGSSRGGRRASTNNASGTNSPNTTPGYHYGCNPLGSSQIMHNDNKSQSSHQQQQQQAYPNYFQQQCNFFPGNSDWTEALGFSVNSLWNCGANGANLSPTMSPNSNPSSPRNGGGGSSLGGGGHPTHVHGAAPTVGVGGGVMYHHQGQPSSQSVYHSTTTNSGYHHPHHPGGNSSNGYHQGVGGGYVNTNSNAAGYNYNATYRNEERNPSYGYGNRGGNSPGVRDTVVM